MTREEVVKWLESLKKEIGKAENRTLWHYAESIDMAIEALSADAVSRDDLIKAYEKGLQAQVVDLTESRPTGEWVRKYDKQINCYWYECNQCGEYRPRNLFGKEWSSPYCPKCGAKMYKGGDSDG